MDEMYVDIQYEVFFYYAAGDDLKKIWAGSPINGIVYNTHYRLTISRVFKSMFEWRG